MTGALRCDACARSLPEFSTAWRCDCGGTLSWHPAGGGALLPAVAEEVTLGETVTPVLERDGAGYKLEYLSHSGSFKDRGAKCVASCLKQMGVREAVLDSSGNAGAAMAAYLAAAGIGASVFAPAHASPGKLRQIEAYGARIVTINGDRSEVTAAAQAHAQDTGAVYAGHLWSPYFIAGMRTLGAELAQLGEVDAVIFPVGSGSLALGALQGIKASQNNNRGLVPRLLGIQIDTCAPLVAAFDAGSQDLPATTPPAGASIAEGILVARPPRARAVLRAIRETGGALISVSDAQVQEAANTLWRQGIYAEPTSAAAEAGRIELLRRGLLGAADRVIVVLTGSARGTRT